MKMVRIIDPPTTNDVQFNADADRLAMSRIRLALFVSGAPVELTVDEIERFLTVADGPDNRSHGYTLAMYWRLLASRPAIDDVVLTAAIEHRVTSDFEDLSTASDSDVTVTLDNITETA